MNPQNLIGKPIVVYIDGERRPIGTITRAVIREGILMVAADLDLSEEAK